MAAAIFIPPNGFTGAAQQTPAVRNHVGTHSSSTRGHTTSVRRKRAKAKKPAASKRSGGTRKKGRSYPYRWIRSRQSLGRQNETVAEEESRVSGGPCPESAGPGPRYDHRHWTAAIRPCELRRAARIHAGSSPTVSLAILPKFVRAPSRARRRQAVEEAADCSVRRSRASRQCLSRSSLPRNQRLAPILPVLGVIGQRSFAH